MTEKPLAKELLKINNKNYITVEQIPNLRYIENVLKITSYLIVRKVIVHIAHCFFFVLYLDAHFFTNLSYLLFIVCIMHFFAIN